MITPGQLPGALTASPYPLPEDDTTTTLRAASCEITSRYANEQLPSPPRLRLMTRAVCVLLKGVTPGTDSPAAHRMPAMMSES